MSATTSAPTLHAPASSSTKDAAVLLLLRVRTFIALILVSGYFAFNAPNFLSADNALIMAQHVALNAFLAIGMTYVIVSGGVKVMNRDAWATHKD